MEWINFADTLTDTQIVRVTDPILRDIGVHEEQPEEEPQPPEPKRAKPEVTGTFLLSLPYSDTDPESDHEKDPLMYMDISLD